MYVYRDYFILHPNQVICRVWSLRLFYRLSLWLAYMLYAKNCNKKKIIIKKCLQKRKVMFSDDVLAAFDVVFAEAPKLNYRRIKTSEARFLCTLGPFPTPRFARSFFIFAVHFAAVLALSMTCFALV